MQLRNHVRRLTSFGWVILIAALAALILSPAIAQTSRGTVTGIVTDPQNATVANITVELESVQTGVKRTTNSNEAGLYRFDAVDLGEYNLKVTATGFQTYVHRGLTVQAGATLAQDVRLEVGTTQTVVEVAGNTVTLAYESAQRGGNLNSQALAQLPAVFTRDVAQVALILPGVSTNRFNTGNATFAVNGSRGRSNNFMVDGTENNDVSVAGQLMQIINPDAIAEVSVQTTNFDAEYGRAGGAVVNTVTKSGTNSLHGSVLYLLDVTNDDAITNTQSLSADIRKRGKPLPGTEQYYGFTVGGPIIKNKTFFFGSFQDDRRHGGSSNNLVTPTAAGWAVLDSLFPKGSNPRVDLYRSIAGQAIADSQPFNVVLGDGRPDVQFGTKISTYEDHYLDRQWMIKIDHTFSEKDLMAVRFIKDGQNDPQGGAGPFFPGFATSYSYPVYNALLSETHVFSPRTTNELRLSYNRAELDYPIDTQNPLGQTMPLYTINGGITPIGVQTAFPQGRFVNNYALQDTASHIHGTHSFRFGTTLTQQRARQFAPIRSRGEIAYQTATGYSTFANFVDDFGGSVGSVQRDFGSPAYYPNYTRQAYFAQDHWRVTPDFTLTLGVRYEYFGTPMNTLKKPAYSGLFNIDPVTLTGPYSDPNKVDSDKNNWAPTVGLAWSPSKARSWVGKLVGEKKTVIRTGYQIGYDSFFNNITSNAAVATPNVIATLVNSSISSSNPRGNPNWSQSLPTTSRPPSPFDSQTLIIKNLVNPYYQRWSFGIQRELPANLLLDVSYVGSKGTKLYANEDLNPLVPSSLRVTPPNTNPTAAVQGRLDNLQGGRLIRTNGGDSNYNSLQVGLDRRLSKDLLVKVSYAYSKNIDNAHDVFQVTNSNTPQNTSLPSIYGGLHIDRSVSQLDRPHRAVFSYFYGLPWLKSQRGALGRMLGGWQISGVTTFESGVPVTITNGPDADGIGSNYDRPDFNPAGQKGVRAQFSTTSPTGYVNPDAGNTPIDPKTAQFIGLPAFAGAPTPARTGNLGRNTERMRGINNFNLNFQKNIRLVERVSMEFRTEMYNIWNHPQYGYGSFSPFGPSANSQIGNIAASVQNSPAGRFLQPQFLDGGGRVIRYQLKLVF
jgi:outer membrane receptor protein involved in Fe transport